MNRRGNLDIILKNMDSTRATKILAKTLYKELVNNGFSNKDIINFSKEMLDFMAAEMKKKATTEASNKKDRLLIG
jgi:nickel-dependent lactate racemase